MDRKPMSQRIEERARRRTEPLPFDAAEAARRLAGLLAGYPEARAAFLFGSQATGKVRRSSDIDIAIWVDPEVPEMRRWDLSLEWAGAVPDALGYFESDVDVIVLNDAPITLAWEVARKPHILWESGADIAMDCAHRIRQRYRDERPRIVRRYERLWGLIRRGEFASVKHRAGWRAGAGVAGPTEATPGLGR